jgi:hypothetical protein
MKIPRQFILEIKRISWCILLLEIFILFLCSCSQKDLCYDHNHASRVNVKFDWRYSPESNASSMLLYLIPTDSNYRTIKKEFIGKQGGYLQALVGVNYQVLGFNSDIENIIFYEDEGKVMATTKEAVTIDPIGIPVNTLPRAEGTKNQRVVMEADSLWSSLSDKDVYITLEDNDNDRICYQTLYPRQRFCTYNIKVKKVENSDKICSLVAASVSGLAAGIRLSDGAKTAEKVIVPFSMSLTGDMELKGNFRCFGKIPDANISNKLVIYAILKDGSKWCYIYDITNQIDAACDPFKVTIVLDKLPIPNKIENNSGLTPGVSDWKVVDIPIKM